MQYQEERTSEVWDEAWPLLIEHFEEISANQDIALNPDIEKYNNLDDLGMLRCYTARDNGQLVGYALFLVHQNMHYAQSKQAQQDVIFLQKDARKGLTGYKLIRFAEDMLRGENVQIVYHHVKAMHNFGKILERQGYKLVDLIYSKRLDKG